jgi:hypothetical protein
MKRAPSKQPMHIRILESTVALGILALITYLGAR